MALSLPPLTPRPHTQQIVQPSGDNESHRNGKDLERIAAGCKFFEALKSWKMLRCLRRERKKKDLQRTAVLVFNNNRSIEAVDDR